MGKQRIYCRNSKIKIKGVSRRGKKSRRKKNPKKIESLTSARPEIPKGCKLTISYKGISPIEVIKFYGTRAEEKAKAFIKSKREDTSIDRIKLDKI